MTPYSLSTYRVGATVVTGFVDTDGLYVVDDGEAHATKPNHSSDTTTKAIEHWR